jgi:hypothetical protein
MIALSHNCPNCPTTVPSHGTALGQSLRRKSADLSRLSQLSHDLSISVPGDEWDSGTSETSGTVGTGGTLGTVINLRGQYRLATTRRLPPKRVRKESLSESKNVNAMKSLEM